MMEAPDDTAGLATEVERLAAGLDHHIQAIATALAARLGQRQAAITTAQHQITRLIGAFTPVHQRAMAAHARATASARDTNRPLSPAWPRLMARAGGLRIALSRWSAVQGLIAAQYPPRRRPLYAPEAPDILSAQAAAADATLAILQAMLRPGQQDATAEERGCFADIALPQSQFLAHLHAAYRALLAQEIGRGTFLDVGCGCGFKPLAATQFFPRVAGLELDRGYVEAARQLLEQAGRQDVPIIEGDAAEFEGYAAFDVIYMFRPMRDEDAMKRLERVVLAQAQPTALLIAPYRGFHVRHEALGCAHIDGHLFLARGSIEDATRLRDAAEHTGPSVARRRRGLPDLWEPILTASEANGFALDPVRGLQTY